MTQIITQKGINDAIVARIQKQAFDFLERCRIGKADYSLTPASDSSPYTLCFALFLANLLGHLDDFEADFKLFAQKIYRGVKHLAIERQQQVDLQFDKAFLQLLAFSLSSLFLLDVLDDYPLDDLVLPLLPDDIYQYLSSARSFAGTPQSGNLAMFIAILLIYARDWLGKDTSEQIDAWLDGHISNMNKFGFWGEEKNTHLQFQNAYHQYEILEYLGVKNSKIENASQLIMGLADKRGQFAPYFGGSGCYDYDAVSIITSPERNCHHDDWVVLGKTICTIIAEQNDDGGFSESQWVRPRSLKSLYAGLIHVLYGNGGAILERGRYFLSLQSPKHNTIHTHWTDYSRQWSESNLWDTWFRLMTIAKIDCAINSTNYQRWGFINFPGIGYHPSARSVDGKA
jgi:hypothetical protein